MTKYFKAQELKEKPFIQWDLWANSDKELKDMGENNNPLIIPEAEIPEYQYNVCPWKIVEGQLVQRDLTEMNTYRDAYEKEQTLFNDRNAINRLNEATFELKGTTYPMYEVARLRYTYMEQNRSAYRVMSTTGIVTINENELDGFLLAYTNQLKEYILL